MRARSGNRLRDPGDGDGLRLLEGGRGACDGGHGDREPAAKRITSQRNHSAGAAADSRRTELLLPPRVAKRDFDRPKTLAREDEDGAATAAAEILLTLCRPMKVCAKTSAGQAEYFRQNDPHPDPLRQTGDWGSDFFHVRWRG